MDKEKKKLANKAEKLFKEKILELADYKCEVCGSNFRITAHHFFPRSSAGHLIYYIPNGVCLCRGCHFAHHFKSDPTIHQTIVDLRGKRWYNKLLEKKREKQKSSYKTSQWIQEQIKKLQ